MPVLTLGTSGEGAGPGIFSSGFGPISVIADGDSITFGAGINANQAYPIVGATYWPSNASITNVAVSGSTVANRIAALPTAVYPLITSAHAAGQKAVVTVMLGHNDMTQASPLTPAQTWSALQTYINDVLSNGADYVCIGTVTPSTVSGFDANRVTLNSTIRSSAIAQGCSAIFDFAGDPLMGPASQAAIFHLYQDGTHPQANPGDTTMATVYAPAIMLSAGKNIGIASVSPSSGTHLGGTTNITITATGGGFNGTTAVFLGGQQATSVVVTDDSHITCTSATSDSTDMVTGLASQIAVITPKGAGVLASSWTWT